MKEGRIEEGTDEKNEVMGKRLRNRKRERQQIWEGWKEGSMSTKKEEKNH